MVMGDTGQLQQQAPLGTGTCGMGGAGAGSPHLRNILQALQLVVLSNVYIWKLWWLALALSGLMFDLTGGKAGIRRPEPQTSRAQE